MTPFGLKIPQRLFGPNQGGRGGGQAGGKDGLGGGGSAGGGNHSGKGSDSEDRGLARQLDKVRGLSGSGIGGFGNGPKGPSGSGPSHYNPKYDTWVSRTPQAQKNLDQAVRDYNNRSFLERALGFVGFGQVDPTTDPNFNAAKHNAPQSSFDAIGMALGLGGMFTGLPAGAFYDAGKAAYAQATGTNPTFGEVNLGDFGMAPNTGYGSVNGQQATGQTDPNESAFGGFFGGGGTGAGASAGGYGGAAPSSQTGDNKGGQGGALGDMYNPSKPASVLSPTPTTPLPNPTAPGGALQSYQYPEMYQGVPGPSPYGYQIPLYNYWAK